MESKRYISPNNLQGFHIYMLAQLSSFPFRLLKHCAIRNHMLCARWLAPLVLLCFSVAYFHIWWSKAQGPSKAQEPSAVFLKGRSEDSQYLAICVMAQNQHEYIVEWVAYHAMQGVGRFNVYDDNSIPSLQPALQPHINSGLVTYHALGASYRDTHPSPQTSVYDQCILDYRLRHRFLAFIDLDEFLFLRDPNISSLPHFLQEFEGYGALGVNRVMFGSSGHEHRPAGNTLANFCRCWSKGVGRVKTIANTAYVHRALNPHQFSYLDAKVAVNENFAPIVGHATASHQSARIAVYHYVLKSRQQYEEKMLRGAGDRSHKDVTFFEDVEVAAVDECWDAVNWSQKHMSVHI